MGKNNNKNDDKNKNDKDKFYFFKIDRDKIKLSLKEIGSKFISRKKSRKKIVLVISFFLLVGVGIALYNMEGNRINNSGNNGSNVNIEDTNLQTGDLTNSSAETSTLNESRGNQDSLVEETNKGSRVEIRDDSSESIDSQETVVRNIEEPESEPQSQSSSRSSSVSRENSNQNNVNKENTDQKRASSNQQNNMNQENVEGVVTEAVAPTMESRNDSDNLQLLKPISGNLIRENGWYYHPVFEDWRYQNGITLAGNSGNIVMAADSGNVISVTEDEYLGVVVKISHGDVWETIYGHLQKAAVSPGEVVGKGQEIGRVGETGITTQPCLYFELSNPDGPVNPVEYFE